ncbi:hypothetical protein SLEP1_g14783 [Rubroshorea leprosula]|uniref:Protein EXECUTER 1, chloroplastic n=1 Tax=Rubroshorea leprosula TaxID=152421 RepID=A0AAV5IR38_9ROSI|nr:hypothetical protein SLEP1_g14783 [Rubroshorea leprosula]
MASISPPTPHKLTFPSHNLLSFRRPFCSPSRIPDSSFCRCAGSSSSSSSSDNSAPIQWRWDSAIQDVLKTAVKRFDSYVNLYRKDARTMDDQNGGVPFAGNNEMEEEDWNWDRWKKHFEQVDEQERLLSVLKSQLGRAVYREDFEDAGRLKVGIAAAATNDTVGTVMSHLNVDNAGTGLVGWWAGVSEDIKDPYGLIIRITAEHGRYVARRYSPRQLAMTAAGVPLFEIFLTVNEKGEYKQQAVYLKRRSSIPDSSAVSSTASGATSRQSPPGSNEDKGDLLIVSAEDAEDGDDTDDGTDLTEGLLGFQNVLRDLIPGVKVTVLKVTAPGKVDRDFISKVVEQIMEEEDEDKDDEIESLKVEDEVKDESDQERDEIQMDSGSETVDNSGKSEMAVKVVVGGLVQKLSGSMPATDRVPAKLEKSGRFSFSFSIEKDINQQDSKEQASRIKAKLHGQRGIENVISDFAKHIGGEKIPLKVLRDVGELINLTLSQSQNRQPLSGSMTFHRIEISSSPDPLNGLYIGAQGLYASEVINLKRKFGQWQEDGGTKETSDLEFYEYVEAVKLTGDPYVPAGQVAFRAKIGQRYQLPHKGIIPEEFGVIARYKGQGRLAEPGFRNPRWVDGELVILDGKYIKGGPLVGFIYWAPEYHFLVFFNRLRLQP